MFNPPKYAHNYTHIYAHKKGGLFFVAAIAIGRGVGLFAKAQMYRFGFSGGEHHRADRRAFVRTVAERLGGRTTARAPRVFFSNFQVDLGGAVARAYCVAHIVHPSIHSLNDA
jgi:hypothetical protein